MEIGEDVELLRQRLRLLKEPSIKAVLLFGSKARGESRNRSDVDLLVLHEGYEVGDAVLRRRHLYKTSTGSDRGTIRDLTVIDMQLKRFLKPGEISSLLLNIYWDAFVVYDLTESVEDFLKEVRRRILKSGLKRVWDGKAYYWVLPEPLKEVKIL